MSGGSQKHAPLAREAALLCRLRHPHVVTLLGVRGGVEPALVLAQRSAVTLSQRLEPDYAPESSELHEKAVKTI